MNPKSETEAVKKFRPYVVREAQRFASPVVSIDDLIQEGLLAVAIAFRAWRPDGGANFLTWIRRPVQFAMLRCLAQHRNSGGTRLGKGERMPTISLDEDLGGEEGAALHDVVGTEEEMPDVLGLALLPEILTKLEPEQREVVRLLYAECLTHKQVGRAMRLPPERIEELEEEALARLRGFIKDGDVS